MALFGPRLDRPSALGDEGRPRATSLTVASLLVFLLLLVATTCPWAFSIRFAGGWIPEIVAPACAGLAQYSLGLATVTGLVTAGLALLNRERITALFLGQLCFLPAGTALIGGVAFLLFVSPSYLVLFAGFALAMLALGSTWTDTASAESVRPALFQEGVTYLAIVFWFVVGGLLYGGVWLIQQTVPSGASQSQPTLSLFGFLVILFFSAVCFRLGLRWLPIRQLSPRHRQAAIERVLRIARLITTTVLVGTPILFVVGLVVAFAGGFGIVYGLVPPVALLFSLLLSEPVAYTALGTGILPLALGVLAMLVRRLTQPADTSGNRILAPFLAGLVLTLGMVPFTFSLLPIPLPIFAVLLLVIFGPIALFLIGWTLVVAQYLSILPERAGGPALAAGGMVLATVGTGIVGLPGPVVLTTAAVAMLVWDVSAYGLGVTAELGHIPETRRLELFHALVGLAVGVVVVLLLSVLDLVRTTVGGGTTAIFVAGVAVLGVLAMLLGLRGYRAS